MVTRSGSVDPGLLLWLLFSPPAVPRDRRNDRVRGRTRPAGHDRRRRRAVGRRAWGPAARLSYLGIAVEAAKNDAVDGDADISDPDVLARTVGVSACEDLEIAGQVRSLLR
jgi:acetate kinase